MRYVMFKLEPLASCLPHRVLRFLSVHVPLLRDPDDGWTFWLAASYRRWCRLNAKEGLE